MPPTRIERVTGRAIVLRGDDIDTDRIMPARFLKAITFEGLEQHLFEDDRREQAGRGAVHPFDEPARRGARILLVQANFGCGSSREHAPQALRRWGIRAIVGESFAEIFFSNALMLGMPCAAVARPDLDRLMALADGQPDLEFVADLTSNHVRAGAVIVATRLPPEARAALVSGDWDTTGLLLERYEDVEHTAARLPYLR
jgi:3-isopropylmalate/(R)-2-methylmalate dehydratase small subunit